MQPIPIAIHARNNAAILFREAAISATKKPTQTNPDVSGFICVGLLFNGSLGRLADLLFI